jgi:hypothetical protein
MRFGFGSRLKLRRVISQSPQARRQIPCVAITLSTAMIFSSPNRDRFMSAFLPGRH